MQGSNFWVMDFYVSLIPRVFDAGSFSFNLKDNLIAVFEQ
jgi:hypothetical protein